MTKLGQDLIQAAHEAIAVAEGRAEARQVKTGDQVDVAAIRRRLGLSQRDFAERFGLNPALVRDWEQKRRNPDQAARTLLTVIAREPEAVARAIRAA